MEELNNLAARYVAEILRELHPAWNTGTDIRVQREYGDIGEVQLLTLTHVWPNGTFAQRTFPLPAGIEAAVARSLRQALVVQEALLKHET